MDPDLSPSSSSSSVDHDPAMVPLQASSSQDLAAASATITSPFLRLPPEIRNAIYKLVLGDIAIHVDGTSGKPYDRYTVFYKTCTAASVNHKAITTHVGAAHDQSKSQATDFEKWKPCDSNLVYCTNDYCPQPVRLEVQLLRVCRQIYDEAALIPHAQNCFVFSGGLHEVLRSCFARTFSVKQRHAIQSVVFPRDMSLSDLKEVPDLLPGVKHLWMEYSPDRGDQRYTLEKEFMKAGFLSLVGVSVNMSWSDEADEFLEKLERALLEGGRHVLTV